VRSEKLLHCFVFFDQRLIIIHNHSVIYFMFLAASCARLLLPDKLECDFFLAVLYDSMQFC